MNTRIFFLSLKSCYCLSSFDLTIYYVTNLPFLFRLFNIPKFIMSCIYVNRSTAGFNPKILLILLRSHVKRIKQTFPHTAMNKGSRKKNTGYKKVVGYPVQC